MRVAALYDIHGNLPALEAVLRDVRDSKVDRVVVGGDVLPGPMQNETMRLLLDLPIPAHFIQGNCEVAVLAEMSGGAAGSLPEQAREVIRWSARRLQPEMARRLAGWTKTWRIEVPNLGPVLFCHGTPRSEDEHFTRLTPEAALLPMFAGVGASMIVCGHTHMQFDRRAGGIRIVNAGSVGMPFGEPGAYWLLLGPGVELRRTVYDFEDAAARVLATDYPQAREFAESNILRPPSEERMLALLTNAPAANIRNPPPPHTRAV